MATAALLDGCQDHLPGDARLAQEIGREAVALADDGQQHVLRRDVFIFQHPRFFHRLIDDALQSRGDEDLSDRLWVDRRPGRARRALEVIGQALFHSDDGRAHALQHLHDQALRQL